MEALLEMQRERISMPSIKSSLTVLFDDPFWVLLYEREYGKKYEGRQYELRRERKKEKHKGH